MWAYVNLPCIFFFLLEVRQRVISWHTSSVCTYNVRFVRAAHYVLCIYNTPFFASFCNKVWAVGVGPYLVLNDRPYGFRQPQKVYFGLAASIGRVLPLHERKKKQHAGSTHFLLLSPTLAYCVKEAYFYNFHIMSAF